ncbi:cytochrome P450 [Aspergillus sergii]|uniref:Cytochrome P450 n=1 Tax=Aspergillus sergii TaxID=1034303 RepID=A0A5N6XIS0_9EURO|nr:cytochrome P450 [Aspergillus sergii]
MALSVGLLLAAISAYILLSAIRNLYFHPLSHLPGPKSWIAFPILRHLSGVRGVFDIEIRKHHRTYGTVIRFSADEVSFIDENAWKEIYGHGHAQLPKHTFSGVNKLDIINSDDVNHARYRKALSHAFSTKGLQAQEPILALYIDKLIQRLAGFAESGLVVDMVQWYNLTTFDLIGDLAFGEPFGGLDSSKYHHWVATIFNNFKVLPIVRAKDAYPWLISPLLALVPKSKLNARIKQREHASATVQKRLSNTAAHGRGDFMDSMLRNRGEKDGLTDAELEANANILIIAGSETTATLLSGVTFLLLSSPETLTKATAEVRTTMQSEDDITFTNVSSQLPYLLACIDEAFRMYPPVPSGLPRISQATMKIAGYTIPPQTKVSVHQSAAYWSPANFHDPDRFIPERWLPEAKENPASPYYNDNRAVVQPFSTGPRNCLGKNLAYAEMRVILARVLWNFDITLCEESRHWRDQKTYILWEKPPLWVKLKGRGGH